ncbi:hypothetical protein QO003_003180 [Arthrobacter silviterrae]|uniref:PucR family transcriptional regulator n=1 Tax=Arthrobacter silviterrae TaxID=2026658 RepID=A0ABX0DD44_9MICC|nr:helix-turn-helix domain-containing protein [Arthrobacter silviterrae]MDQ0278877.1 hypothetical protein [Arthrobacter silviterrae]NGN84854.1 PucR family transcriptional regulator [Arthrobacter silviterrae]
MPNILDPDIFSVELIPSGTAQRVESVGLLELEGAGSNDVVLLVVPGSLGDLLPLLAIAADQGAKLVITDPVPDEDRTQLLQSARTHGLAVVWRRPGIPWLAVADILRNVFRDAEVDNVIESSGVSAGDLTSLAEALSIMIGGPVIMEDAKLQLLSYSTSTGGSDRWRDLAILSRKIPDAWLEHLETKGLLDTLLTTDTVLTVDGGPFEATRRFLCAIRSERFFLGVLWVAEGDSPLPDDVEFRMAQAARIAAPHLVRHHEDTYSHRTSQHRMLRRLLESGELARAQAEELGIQPAESYTVFALRAAGEGSLGPTERTRALESVSIYCQSYRWKAASCAIGNTIYCVLAHDFDRASIRLPKLAASMLDAVRKSLLGNPMTLALSQTTTALSETATLRVQVDQTLEAVALWPQGDGTGVVSFDQAAARITLLRVMDEASLQERRFCRLEILRTEDAQHGSDYIQTLSVYLANFGDVRAAAAQLQLHATSLRYRLKRIAELSGINLAEPIERLLCELLLTSEQLTERRTHLLSPTSVEL